MNRTTCMAIMASVLFGCGGEEATTAPPAAPTPPTPVAATPPPADTAAPAPAPKPSLADLEKKTLSDWFAAFNAHDMKQLGSLYATDAVAAHTGPGGWQETKGGEAIASTYAPVFTALPDVKVAPVRVLQKNDVVVVEWAAVGTNTGDFMGGPPSNKKAGILGADIFSFGPDGLISRHESFHDHATIAQQLGKMPGKARELATLPTADAVWITASGSPDEDKLVDQMKNTWPATWNKHDVKAYGDVINDDSIHVEIAGPTDYVGRAALIKELQMYTKALPDMSTTIDKAWAFAPNIVVAEFTFGGTMKGAIGPFKPTNKPITIHGLDVDELKNGKMQRGVTYTNGTELLDALGVLPKHGEKAAKEPTPGANTKAPKK